MILEFSFENYLSFQGLNRLSFVAEPIKEHPSNLFQSNRENLKVLRSMGVYGSNSSGKSNLFKGFALMRNMVLNSSRESQTFYSINVTPFKLAKENEAKPTMFEVVFLYEDIKYRYGFRITDKQVVEEWLFFYNNKKQENVFIRSNQIFNINKVLRSGEYKNKIQMLTELTRENALFISVLAQFNVKIAKITFDWFDKSTIVFDANNQEIIDFTANILNEDFYNSKINGIISKSDLGFTSVHTEEKIKAIAERTKLSEGFISMLFKDDYKSYRILTKHKQFENSKAIGSIYFDLILNESLGSQKYFALLGPIVFSLNNGGILFIDELDSKLHNYLILNILNLFNSNINNPKNAQLIFSSQNTIPLKNSLRRDQMIFMEKDAFGASTVESLYKKKRNVRNDASFEKDYIDGKYGSVPKIAQLNLFNDETD